MKIFGHNENKCKQEIYGKEDVYSKTETYSKTEVYSKGEVYKKTETYSQNEINDLIEGKIHDISILTGFITASSASSVNSKEISYPEGFNKNNCVPISYGVGGIRTINNQAGLNYGSNGSNSSEALFNGGVEKVLVLNDNHIQVGVYIGGVSSFTSKDLPYKLVLMKIAE